MNPYYDDGKGIVIYHGDCREILPTLPKVDLVLTDPPYGINENYASYIDRLGELRVTIAQSMPLIIKNSVVAILTVGVGNIFEYPKPTWTLAWVTPAGCGSGPWGFCCWQPVLAYGKDPYLVNGLGRRPDCILHTESAEENGHPCPKPIGFWSKLLLRGSPKDSDYILDPFMGSGTTLRAAKDLGRRAIGIEIEERYCEIAARRLQQEVLQLCTTA